MPTAGGFVLDGGTYSSRVAIFSYVCGCIEYALMTVSRKYMLLVVVVVIVVDLLRGCA